MTPIIEMQNITYKYQENEEKKALNNVSFTINPGEWVAIIGHNGSGKSTLAKVINGLLVAQKGTVQVAGLPLDEEHVWEIRRKIGMVFQNPDNQFVGATVEDDVAFGLENQGLPREEMIVRVQGALERVRMTEYYDKEPARLSGGQKQRVAVASVVALQPDVIILDEATSMLDPRGREDVLTIIQKLKKEQDLTVISITHDINEAANADRVLVMREGEIINDGTPSAIFSAGPELIKMGLDVPFPEQLKVALEERGVSTPTEYLTEERMVDWLWTSFLKR